MSSVQHLFIGEIYTIWHNYKTADPVTSIKIADCLSRSIVTLTSSNRSFQLPRALMQIRLLDVEKVFFWSQATLSSYTMTGQTIHADW